jgi:fatty-acyl-CoA synthase
MHDQGIGSWPARRARKTPDRIALLHEDRTVTYAELHHRTAALAAALSQRGIGAGDRVAFLGPNHPAFLETLFATASLGAVFVPLNTRLATPELTFQLRDSGAGVLLAVRQPPELLAALAAEATVMLPAEGAGYEELIAEAPTAGTGSGIAANPADPCMIMYTSGTTGRPKGAVLTHGNVVANAVNVVIDVDLAADDLTLVAAPMFHTGALNMSCLPTLLKGGTVLLQSAFEPDQALELIGRHRVTFLFGVPTMFDMLAARPGWDEADLSSVRTLLCGGSPVPARTIRRYLERGLAFVQGYGLTESGPGILMLDKADALAHAGSAGVPHFLTDVRVVRPDGSAVDVGEPGEVQARGPNIVPGYWRRPEDSAAAFADGEWLRTGDIARIDAHGYVTLVDRVKDMIISGGENVYPAEVESALLDHPAVAECAVFGVPDPVWGEVGRAVVVLVDGADASEAFEAADATEAAEALLAHLGSRLARYKIPKSVVFTDALPKSGAGKVLKEPLRIAFGGP